MSALDDKRDMVSEMVVKSQKTGITIDQRARQREGAILALHDAVQIGITIRIKSIYNGIMAPAYYVATNILISSVANKHT